MASLNGSLDDFFSAEKRSGSSYTDIDFLDISTHLNADGFADWASNPRIYVVLRLLGRVDAMQDFLRLGLGDLCLPFQKTSQLPRSLGTMRDAFIEKQSSVLTTTIILEKGLSEQKHANIGDDSEFPYETLGPLGRGRYQVDQVRSPYSGEVFARKVFRRTQVSKSAQEEFLNELTILKRIDHEHCVRLVGSYTNRRCFGLLMYPVAECNLAEFLALAKGSQSKMNTLGTFYGCLSAAVMYLHESKIRHRDIKPANILVKGKQVYLTDFGISLNWEHLSRSTTTEESGKTLVYCAPEVAEQFQKRNSATDIWSLGCVFMEMLVVRHGMDVNELSDAFYHHSESRAFHQNTSVIADWLKHKIQEPRPDGSGRSLSQLMLAMLSRSATERPSADTVYHMLSTFKSRGADAGNPYCGECCAADLETDSEIEVPSPLEGPVLSHSKTATKASPTVARLPAPHSPLESLHHSPLQGPPSLKESSRHSTKAISRAFWTVQPANNLNEAPKPRKLTRMGLPQASLEGSRLANSRSPASRIQSSPAQEANFVSPTNRRLFRSLKIPAWPTIDLQGNLPYLDYPAWSSPSKWKAAIGRDFHFMQYILTHQSRLEAFIVGVKGDDFLTLLHILLYNGLKPHLHHQQLEREHFPSYRWYNSKPHPTPILSLAIDSGGREKGDTWHATGVRISMIRLVAAFCGLDNERLCDSDGREKGPLTAVVDRNDMESFKVLLEAGADPDEKILYANRSIYTHVAYSGNLDAVKLLTDNGAKRVSTALRVAASKGYGDIVSHLLSTEKYETLLDADNGKGTPLYRAAAFGHAEVVRLLFQWGANARAVCSKTRTEPLTIAAFRGHLDVVKVLVEEAGVDPDAHPKGGDRALRRAPINSNVEKYLLSQGAKPATTMEVLFGLRH